jgi:hypothetical protein
MGSHGIDDGEPVVPHTQASSVEEVSVFRRATKARGALRSLGDHAHNLKELYPRFRGSWAMDGSMIVACRGSSMIPYPFNR